MYFVLGIRIFCLFFKIFICQEEELCKYFCFLSGPVVCKLQMYMYVVVLIHGKKIV